ncbi:MAG TPA: phosphate ABC transporter permease subunit PstC [Gemmataceae bacterium]|nr:phosphate ABC transporter permease subunit PstC [Gemmataceae bacterium]
MNLARMGDRVTRLVCKCAALSVIVLAILLVITLVWHAWLSIQTNGIGFFTETTWDPEESHRVFGSLAFVYGMLVSSALAMLIAVPLGVGTAAFLSEIAPAWLRRTGSFLVEMLAAVPSVVYGFWGMYVLGPSLQRLVSGLGGPNFGGVGILPAGLILAIMIVPYVAAVSFDVCRAVPASQREAALALGATRWQMIRSVVLPYARPGIIGACFLALGRAVGETMAVTMLIGNSPVIDPSLFAKGDTIASAIANQFAEATYDLYVSALVELGLVLLLVTTVVNSLARFLIYHVGRAGSPFRLLPWRRSSPGFAAVPRSGERAAPADEPDRLARRGVVARWTNRVMTGILFFCLVAISGPLFLVLGYLVYQGVGAINWDFFVNLPTAVGKPGGGMANALAGSAMLVSIATLLAVPVGLLAAIYLTEYRDGVVAPTVRFIGELLGGVPSIVIGIFAYTLVVRTAHILLGAPGFYGWAGVFALAIMMVPIVMRASEEALKLVPSALRQASYALGANQWQTLARVTVPAALPAIITAVFLAIARIVGETAPLLLTAGMNPYWPRSLDDYTPSLPVYIFNYANSPYEDWHRQAWAAALLLLTVVMVLNFGIRFLTGKKISAGRND